MKTKKGEGGILPFPSSLDSLVLHLVGVAAVVFLTSHHPSQLSVLFVVISNVFGSSQAKPIDPSSHHCRRDFDTS